MVLCVADKEVNPLNDKRLTNGSLALNNKKVITIDAVKILEEAKLRVAAYARVSSDSTDQLYNGSIVTSFSVLVDSHSCSFLWV